MKVVVLGAGRMGAQIGVEYLLAGHDVAFSARDTPTVTERVRDGLALVERLGRDLGAAGSWRVSADPDIDGVELIVESLPEDLSLKTYLLAPLAAAAPGAIVATNTSSLPIAELGAALGAPERTIGTHYWNPPLLMPLVEVIPGTATDPRVVERVVELIESLGKQVVLWSVDPADWSRQPSRARPVLAAAHQLSQASVTYLPALRTYILASSYFPFAADWPAAGTGHRTTWAFYQAPHPWGPWTRFYSGPSPLGFYDPAFVPKFITMGGLGQVALAAADFGRPSLYRLHAFPVTLRRRRI